MDMLKTLSTAPPFCLLPIRDQERIFTLMNLCKYQPGDLLISELSQINSVGMLVSGKAEVCFRLHTPSPVTIHELRPYEFFGELACLTQKHSPVSVICRHATSAYVMSYFDFHQSLEAYPSLKSWFIESSLQKLWQLFQVAYKGGQVSDLIAPPLSDPPIGIQKALQFIDANYELPLTVDQTAHVAGMSKSSFSRHFNQSLGISFKTYLNQMRVSKAKFLISNKRMNITEACFAVGFNDTAYFSRVFRKVEGQSPIQFKKALKFNKKAVLSMPR